MALLYPRRFGACHQVSYDFPGTVEQQQALRDAIHPVFGTKFHDLSKRFARTYKAKYAPDRSYVTWFFQPMEGYLALAGAVSVAMSDRLTPSAINDLARHEYGHLVDKHLLIQEDRLWFMEKITGPNLGGNDWPHNYQETWADAVKDWVNSDGASRPDLTSILLP